jgi:hypothetical protein
VHGSCALLLRPEQVTAEQAAQFKLERIEVLPREASRDGGRTCRDRPLRAGV